MNVYKFDNGSISSTTTSATATGTATTTGGAAISTTPSATPTSSFGGFGNFTYSGCYKDNAGGRILTQVPDNNTVDGCIAYCSSNGYTVAGMEYYYQCFCGNKLINGATLADADTQCSTPCQGNATQFCGGPDRMSVYTSLQNLTIVPAPKIVKTGLPAGWTYQGCLRERPAGGPRVLPLFRGNDDTTALSCLARCDTFGEFITSDLRAC